MTPTLSPPILKVDRRGAPHKTETTEMTAKEAKQNLDPAERTRCEVWTRVMGYHRPTSAFNRGKRAEHRDRRYFKEATNERPPVR